jgi:hypothetical protein
MVHATQGSHIPSGSDFEHRHHFLVRRGIRVEGQTRHQHGWSNMTNSNITRRLRRSSNISIAMFREVEPPCRTFTEVESTESGKIAYHF